MLRLFNLGLNQKRFGGNHKIANVSINLGNTKGRGSSTRIFNYCKQRSQNPSECISQFIPSVTPINKSNLLLSYLEGRGPGAGILNTHFGWDANGVWFAGDANDPSNERAPSYPIFTNPIISQNKKVEVSVDFVYNEECSDFGLCFYQDGTVPEWRRNNINSTRIACQYDCSHPEVSGLTNIYHSSLFDLTIGNTYTCNVTYDPISNPSITLNTLLDGSIVDTITLNDQTLSGAYRIGFSADRDGSSSKTYIKNLTVNVNNGELTYSSSLQTITIPPFV